MGRRRAQMSHVAAGVLLAALLLTVCATAQAAPNGAMLWGFNDEGQLGVGHLKIEGERSASLSPIPIEGLTGLRSISQNYSGAMALMEDGSVLAWGANEDGQLGEGENLGPELCPRLEQLARPCAISPRVVPGLPGAAVAVSQGSEFDLALMENGTVMAWGADPDGQLGLQTNTGPELCENHSADSPEACSMNPVQIPGLSHVKAIAAGTGVSYALMEDGTVMAWGYDDRGELGVAGRGDTSCDWEYCVTRPEPVEGLSGVTALSVGTRHVLALLADGDVMAWGTGETGELGLGAVTHAYHPTQIPGLSEVVEVSAGYDESAALLADGTVMQWGQNEHGQLGQGTTEGPENCLQSTLEFPCSTKPIPVPGLSGVKSIATGWEYTLALMSDGTLMGWGSNNGGTLGTGPKPGEKCNEWECARQPIPIPGLADVTAIAVSAGGEDSAAYGPLLPAVEVLEAEEPSEAPVEEPGGEAEHASWRNRTAHAGVRMSGSGTEAGGSELGGTRVVIKGTDLAGATAVHFGGEEASYTVAALGRIIAFSPPGSGTVQVTVTTPRGESPLTRGDSFTYVKPTKPTLIAISPAQGPPGGGTQVTISGANLADATGVFFGGRPAQSFAAQPNGQLSAVSPAGTGIVDVTVITPHGETKTSKQDLFTYLATVDPLVTKVSPSKVPAAGGVQIQITGQNFSGVSAVSIGGEPALSYTANSKTSITAVVPPGTAGEAAVTVFAGAGSSPRARKSVVKYSNPLITGVDPAEGPTVGGGTVTVEGVGFAPGIATSFHFGRAPSIQVYCVSSSVCNVTVPAVAKPGPVVITAAAGRIKTKHSYLRLYTYR